MIEQFEFSLQAIVSLAEFCMETVAVFCVLMGLLSSVSIALRHPLQVLESHFLLLRLRLGSWLALALEFQLGADILSTTIAPSFEALGKLGAIALIRTFLNYFLSRELVEEEARESQLRTLKQSARPQKRDPR